MPSGKGGRGRQPKKRESLTIVDMSDLALLHILDEHEGDDGWADSKEIAQALNLDTTHPASNVGSRFAWLKTVGVVETQGNRRWRMTGPGRKLFEASLTKREQSTLEEVQEERMLAVTEFISTQLPSLPEAQRHLMRRQWQYGLAQMVGVRGALRRGVRGR